MTKYKLTLEYDGSRYSGWQAQKNARSVQSELIRAAQTFCGGTVDVQGAGRTDTGVHAIAQVAHLGCEKLLGAQQLLYALNDNLPHDVCVTRVEKADARFHARHHAEARSYLYIIAKRKTAFGKKYVWWVKDALDFSSIEKSSKLFIGFHDFASFADTRMDKEASTHVELRSLEAMETEDMILLRVVGSHFLWKMVRRMVGVLVEVGRGRISHSDAALMLTEFSSKPAQHTAPPSGLYLAQVLYKGDELEPMQLPRFSFMR